MCSKPFLLIKFISRRSAVFVFILPLPLFLPELSFELLPLGDYDPPDFDLDLCCFSKSP